MPVMTGGCFCGRIRYRAEPKGPDAYLCHCSMCRRTSGNVSLALVDVPVDTIVWDREPDWFVSSPIARRPYCASCGTSLGFQFADGKSALMDLTVGSFDAPDYFRCVAHCAPESRLAAWHGAATDGLAEHPLADNPSTRDRWLAACGRLPD